MRSCLNLLTTALLAAATVSATTLLSGASVLRADDVLSKPYISLPTFPGLGVSVAAASLPRRQSSQDGNSTAVQPAAANGTLNFTAWDNSTGAACVARLSAVTRSTNPSGDCICYNLPMLDTSTGMFEADLRLYRVSVPRDAFTGVSPADIQVGVVYKGASVSLMKPATSGGSSGAASVNVSKRAEPDFKGDGPTLLQTYMLVGQIDKSEMGQNLSMADLETLLIPTLTLTATTPTGGRVSTNVSLNEASFLTGVFSTDVVLSDFAAAQLAVDDEVAALKNGTVAFVLPGTQLMIFPVGLVITSAWLLLGLVAYGFGTYERVQYAGMYRRRLLREAERK